MDDARLVGRDQELRLLRGQLDHARAGEARIIFITGEAGVGKTSRARAAAAASPDFLVISASGEESEQDLPYGVADQLFAGLSAGPAASAGPTPLAVGAALLRALSDAQQSSDSAFLVVIDDVQWVDVSSQQALVFALRRLRADSVCVLLCSRAEDEPSLVPGLQRLRRHAITTSLELTGLSESGIATLAGQAKVGLPADAVARLHRHTGGNPLWSKALLSDIDREHLADPRRPLPAPQPFAEIVRHRLSGLSSGARALVETSAVAGTDWPLSSLAAIAEVASPYQALADAIEIDLIREVGGSPVRVRPAHALVSAAVLATIDVNRRSDLHFRLARAATTEHDRLHHEVSASAGSDDHLAARLERHGHDLVLGGQWVAAASTLGTAARLRSSRDRRAELTEEAMAMALLAGDVGQAVLLSRELAAMPDRPRALSLQGWLALARGRHQEAESLLRRAVERAVQHAPSDVEAQARMILAQLLIFGGRAGEAVTEARRATDLATAGTPAASHAKGLLGVALGMSGDVDRALAELGDVDPEATDPTAFPVLVARGSTLVTAA